MPALPWFRMYAKFMTDPDVEELSFEDQRHFVFVLCMTGGSAGRRRSHESVGVHVNAPRTAGRTS